MTSRWDNGRQVCTQPSKLVPSVHVGESRRLTDGVRVSGQELDRPLAILSLVAPLALATLLEAQVPAQVSVLLGEVVVEGTRQSLHPHRVLLQLVGLPSHTP